MPIFTLHIIACLMCCVYSSEQELNSSSLHGVYGLIENTVLEQVIMSIMSLLKGEIQDALEFNLYYKLYFYTVIK